MAAPSTARPRTIRAKILPGWLSREVAIPYLMNECVFEEPLTADAAERVWQQYRDRVEALPERDCRAPAQLPLSREEQRVADQFLAFHRQAGPNGSVRSIIKINPRNLIAYQPHVLLEQSENYSPDATDAVRYSRHSLAVGRGSHNIQVNHGLNAMDVPVPHGEFAFMFNQANSQFGVIELARHISVTPFRDRMLLFAGYHRSYAFMAKENPEGIERSLLVAVTTDGDFLVSPQSPNQGLRVMVCGLRPAFLSDFLDETFFMEVNLRRKRFVLQIRAACTPVDEL